jgi:hypothetical protein
MFFDLFDLLLKLENLLFCGGEFFAKGLEYLFIRHLITGEMGRWGYGDMGIWGVEWVLFDIYYFQFYYVSNVIYGLVIRLNLLLNMFMKSK